MNTLDDAIKIPASNGASDSHEAANDEPDIDNINVDEDAHVSIDAKQVSEQLRRYAIKLAEARQVEDERGKQEHQGQGNQGQRAGFGLGLGLGVSGFLAHRRTDSIKSTDLAASLIEKMDRMNDMMVSATSDKDKAKIRRALAKDGESLMKHLDNAMSPESMMAAGRRGMKQEDMVALRDGARKWAGTFEETAGANSMKEKLDEFFKRISEMFEKLFKSSPARQQEQPLQRPE